MRTANDYIIPGMSEFRLRVLGLYSVLLVANLVAWAWAFLLFHDYPALLGSALLAYGLGLRHAADADHIAAIDNVVRELMVVNLLNDNFNTLGIAIVGAFIAAWVVSVALHGFNARERTPALALAAGIGAVRKRSARP